MQKPRLLHAEEQSQQKTEWRRMFRRKNWAQNPPQLESLDSSQSNQRQQKHAKEISMEFVVASVIMMSTSKVGLTARDQKTVAWNVNEEQVMWENGLFGASLFKFGKRGNSL